MKLDEAINEALSAGSRTYFDVSFVPQHGFVRDVSRFLVAQCSRRAGKTNGLALRFFNTLEAHPNSFCPYIALTRESAYNIMWPVLQELDEKYKVGMNFTESNLTATHPNGARLQLFGADMKNFIKRLKGIKTPGAAIDEAQDFGEHIQSLVDDVLTPAMTDYSDSWLALTGTPGPIPRGYFYEITEQKKFGFSIHRWTLLDNPYLPQAMDFIKDMVNKRQWSNDNPTLLREWRNQWVLDVESLLIRYDESKNHYDTLPPGHYSYITGVDLGIKDSDALATIAYGENSDIIFLVDETITSGQGVTELAHQIKTLQKTYDIHKFPTDEGALGKKIAEEIRRRFQIPLTPADKARKMENVALLNDYLRLGKFKAKKDSRFAQDSYRVQIDYEKSTPDRIVVKSGFHSDIIDAVLYSFRESPAYSYRAPDVKPMIGTKAWADEQVSDMEDAAEEFFKNQESAEEGYGGEW